MVESFSFATICSCLIHVCKWIEVNGFLALGLAYNCLIHVCKWIEVVTQIAFKRKDTRLIHVCKWIEVRYIHRLNRCVTVLYMCVSGLKLLLSSMSVSRLKSYTCV